MRKIDELEKGCMAKAGDLEMIFVLLSRDSIAAKTIRFWVQQRILAGKNTPDDPQILEALECARTMDREKALHKGPPSDKNKVIALCRTAVLYGGNHGKLWVEDGKGKMLGEVQASGRSEDRRSQAWASALKELESIAK